MRFVNAELARLGLATIGMDRVVDTLALARKKHPGPPNSLDALCDRYRIDRSRRVRHGALLDAEILVEIYCELTGGRQRSLLLDDAPRDADMRRCRGLVPRSESEAPEDIRSSAEESALTLAISKVSARRDLVSLSALSRPDFGARRNDSGGLLLLLTAGRGQSSADRARENRSGRYRAADMSRHAPRPR